MAEEGATVWQGWKSRPPRSIDAGGFQGLPGFGAPTPAVLHESAALVEPDDSPDVGNGIGLASVEWTADTMSLELLRDGPPPTLCCATGGVGDVRAVVTGLTC